MISEQNAIYRCKLADLLCACGDYEYQAVILETLFRMNPGVIKEHARNLFPEAERLQESLLDISISSFDKDARIFLNLVNKINETVFSIAAEYVFINEIRLMAPKVFVKLFIHLHILKFCLYVLHFPEEIVLICIY